MRDVRDILEQGVRGFDPGDGFDKTRRRVRRRQLTRRLVAAGTSLAVAAAGGVFAWRTFTDRAVVPPRPAASRLVVESMPLPDWPRDVAVSGDSLWALIDGPEGSSPVLLRLDSASGEIMWRSTLRGDPIRVVASPDAVWALDSEAAVLLRVDPIDGGIVARVSIPDLPFEAAPGDKRFVPTMLGVTDDRVWVGTARGAVAVIDPRTNAVQSVRQVGLPPLTSMEQSPSATWLYGPSSWDRLDSPTGVSTAGAAYEVDGDRLTHLVATDERAWGYFLRSGLREIWPVERRAGISIPRTVGPIVEVSGLIYAISYSESGEVGLYRIATDPLRIIEGPLPLPAIGPVTTDGETLWLADFDGSRLIRVSIRQQDQGSGPSTETCGPGSLKPSHVPDGFDGEPWNGPGGGVSADAWPGDAVHYQGPDPGTHITVTLLEGAAAVREPHLDGESIDLELGPGTIGGVEDGFSVEARWEHARGPCSIVWITAYGVSKGELRRFAESLRDTGP